MFVLHKPLDFFPISLQKWKTILSSQTVQNKFQAEFGYGAVVCRPLVHRDTDVHVALISALLRLIDSYSPFTSQLRCPLLQEVFPSFPPPGAYSLALPCGPAGLQGEAPTLDIVLFPPSPQYLHGAASGDELEECAQWQCCPVSKSQVSKVTLCQEADVLQLLPE